MKKRLLPEVKRIECSGAPPWRGKHLLRVAFAVVLSAAGCGDTTRRTPVPPRAVTNSSAMQKARAAHSEPVLQQLSREGAIINTNAHDKDGSTFWLVSFLDAEICTAKAQSLSRLFAPAPTTSAEIGAADRPIRLVFERCRVAREAMSALNGARRLCHLSFIGTQVDDNTFVGVKSLPELRGLNIDNADIGDDGLLFLGGSPALEALSARGTRVGDATLARLENAHEMEVLELTRTKVTGQGLQSASRFSKLHRLDVSNCDITDAGVAHLSRLSHLTSLNLGATKITDAGVRHLRGLNLEILEIRNTDTSDACLKYLTNMHHLAYLGTRGTSITAEGIAKVLPNLPSVGWNTDP